MTAEQDKLNALDAFIESQQKTIEAARTMRQLLQDHPNLMQLLPTPGNAAPPPPPSEGNGAPQRRRRRRDYSKATRGPTTREYCRKIIKALESAKGGMLTVNELAEKTALKREAVTQVLYRSFAELFDKDNAPESNLVKVWRLKPGVTLGSLDALK